MPPAAGAAGACPAEQAVLGTSEALPAGTPLVRGYEFPPRGDGPGGAGAPPPPVDYERLLDAMATTGFQATSFGEAVAELNRMIAWRLSDEPVTEETSPEEADPAFRARTRCKARVAAPMLACCVRAVCVRGAERARACVRRRRFSWASRPT
jgi:hypothetical protein